MIPTTLSYSAKRRAPSVNTLSSQSILLLAAGWQLDEALCLFFIQ